MALRSDTGPGPAVPVCAGQAAKEETVPCSRMVSLLLPNPSPIPTTPSLGGTVGTGGEALQPVPRAPVPASPSTRALGSLDMFIERHLQPGPGLGIAARPGTRGPQTPPSRVGKVGRQPWPCLRLPTVQPQPPRLLRGPRDSGLSPSPPTSAVEGSRAGPDQGLSVRHRAHAPKGQLWASSWGAWLGVHCAGSWPGLALTGPPAGPCLLRAARPAPPRGTGSCRRPRLAAGPPGAAGSLQRGSSQRVIQGPPSPPQSTTDLGATRAAFSAARCAGQGGPRSGPGCRQP